MSKTLRITSADIAGLAFGIALILALVAAWASLIDTPVGLAFPVMIGLIIWRLALGAKAKLEDFCHG